MRHWPRIVAGVLVAGIAPVLAPSANAAAPCLQSVGGVDLTAATIAELSAAMASGKLSSVALVDAYAARIAAYDHATDLAPNSVRALNPKAREQAAALDAERNDGRVRGPLHGIPILLKDNIGTADQPTTAGSIALEQNIPKRDANIVTRLRRAGAVILGKANLAEFANWVSLDMPNGYSSLGGQVLSAYNGSNPSGSSSGSTVAMSLGLAAVTIGSETAGSIVSPASYAGVVGVKPSLGLVSRTGVVPLAASWDTTGPITRSVADAALVLNAISGEDAEDASTTNPDAKAASAKGFDALLGRRDLTGVRIGFDPTGPGLDVTESGPVFAQALTDLAALGATVVEVPGVRLAEVTSLTELGGIFNEFKAGINQYLASEAGPGLPVKTLADIIAFNEAHPDKVKYGQNLLQVSNATPGNAELGAVQATPTIASTAATLDALFTLNSLDALVGPGDWYSYHGAASHWASLVVPAGMRDGVPEALQFIGRPFSEPELLSYAAAFEPRGAARVPAPTSVNTALVAAACASVTAAAPARVQGEILVRTGRGIPLMPILLVAIAALVSRRLVTVASSRRASGPS